MMDFWRPVYHQIELDQHDTLTTDLDREWEPGLMK